MEAPTCPLGKLEVGGVGVVDGVGDGEVERDAEVLGAAFPQRIHGQPVGKVLVVHGGDGCRGLLPAGGVHA